MNDLPVTRFLLELKLGDEPPTAVLKPDDPSDRSGCGVQVPVDMQLGATPPYELGLTFDVRGGVLRPQLKPLAAIPALPSFDPTRDGDDGILSIDWHFARRRPIEQHISDRPLETQDKAALRLTLFNRSHYYEFEDLTIILQVMPPKGAEPLPPRPDGNELVSIWPPEQSARSIRPQGKQSFDYLVATRGPRAGLYTMAIEVSYTLVYVYREPVRQTTASAHLPLRIRGGSTPPFPDGFHEPTLPLSKLERISISQRRLHMAQQDIDQDQKGRELHAIESKTLLPGGGEVAVFYRLVKGSHTRPDDSRPSFGWNPVTKDTESYFSTEDEAAMEITIVNMSALHFKHVHLTDVHLHYQNKEGGRGPRADDQRLPDGNLLAEVVPDNVYFGTLMPGEKRTRHLGLVTRGVRPGRFLVSFDMNYEIVDGRVGLDLRVDVKPD